MPKFDEYTLGNIGDFIQGFTTKRAQIAEANQADKEYKLKTVETMFKLAEGRRAQADASQALADDTSLSPDARARHRAAAEQSLQEGARIYAGASELFGMIDEKPKTGKKPNPAMQFLQFVNPFVKRGPEAGEFEARLNELMVGLGGKGQAGAGAGGGETGGVDNGTAIGAGLGDLPTRGQGAPTTPGADLSGLIAAMPGGAAEARTATTGQILAAERGEPLRGAETIPGTIFPTETMAGIPQPSFAPGAPPPSFPFITGGRYAPQFSAMPTDQYNDGVALEVRDALNGLAAIQHQTADITETFEDMANNPQAWELYSVISQGTAMHPDLDTDKFDRDLAMIFPDLRENRPEVGETILRDFEQELRRTVQLEPRSILGENGEILPMKFWPPRLQKKAARYSVFESVATDKPEVSLAKRFIDAVRLEENARSPQHIQDIKAYRQARIELGMGGGAGGTAGATENITYGTARHPETGQMAMVRRGSKSGQVDFVINPATNQPFFTGRADISRWQAKTPTMVFRDGRFQEIFPMLPFTILADLQAGATTRALLRPLMESPMFDNNTRNIINDFLLKNPDVGGPEPPGYVPQRLPNPYRRPVGGGPEGIGGPLDL